jgi:hypothetical protein
MAVLAIEAGYADQAHPVRENLWLARATRCNSSESGRG